MADNTLVSFDCGICLESTQARQKDVRRISSDSNDQVCSDCVPYVLERFNLALANEIDFPPKWGGEEIEIELWSDLLDKKFMKQWDKKVSEYACPVQHRTYCLNKRPVPGDGSKKKVRYEFCNNYLPALDPSKLKKRVYCRVCRQWTCVACKSPAGSSLEAESHACVDTEDSKKEDEDFDEKTKGTDWQQCPNQSCAVKIALHDGCNAMTCTFCNTGFCFLCGEAVAHNSHHWSQGKKCPRFGKADDEDPVFDAAEPAPQEPIEVEGEDGLRVIVHPDSITADFPMILHYRSIVTLLMRGLMLELRLGLAATGELSDTMIRVVALLRIVMANVNHIIVNWAVHDAPEAERQVVDPIQEAIAADNFTQRDRRLATGLDDAWKAAVPLARVDSMLHGVDREFIVLHYEFGLKPGYEDSVLRFVDAQEADRELFVNREA